MLHGRAPPPTNIADGALSVSRRNSFSRDFAASIDQTRSPSSADSINIQLHVKRDTLRSLSPRKSASFSLPRSPRQDEGASINSDVRVLRPTLSDVQLHRLLDDTRSVTTPLAHAGDLLVLDSPGNGSGYADADANSSATSSSYSPVSPTRGGDDEDDGSDCGSVVDDPDAFETWLQEAHVLESPIPASRQGSKMHDTAPEASEPLPGRKPSLELSKSVQQIEHEIRLAIDAAAVRVAGNGERGELFTREQHGRIATPSPISARDDKESPPKLPQEVANEISPSAEPELLLLMDVLIGDGRSETIEIHVGDRPQQLAEAFAVKHRLVTDAIPRLVQHIQDQLDALDEEQNEERTGDYDEPAILQEPATATSDIVDQYTHCVHHIDQPHPSFGHDHSNFHDDRSAFNDDSNSDEDNDSHDNESIPVAERPPPPQHREHEREYNYNHLMEKYGHYTSHTNKVNPSGSGLSLHRYESPSDPLTMRNVEHARLLFTPRPAAFATGKHQGKDKETVYNRLYSLAEAREKWLRRQQKAKAADEVRERQTMRKLEISSKSRDMVAGRGDGGYAHIGERLYDEALSDLAKKQRARDKREQEKDEQLDWTCPKCAFVNQPSDAVCKNVVASALDLGLARRETLLTAAALVDAHPEVVCGHARPEELFRPTLLVAPASVARAVHHHKLRATAASSQRQRTQQQREDEFRQTCPFKPKINEMSEEIMREKLEQEAKAKSRGGAGVMTTATGDVRRKNPHQALYEDAFHARAQREAREEAHLKQYSFKPNIGVNALWSRRNSDDADADVVERLAVSKYQELERKRASLHVKYAPDRDPETGREYFKPETGRAPIFNRNERGLPIGDFLYEAHKEQKEYLRHLRQQESDQCRLQSETRFVSAKSEQALAARKKKTFARLFDWLLKCQSIGQEDKGEGEPRVVPSALDTSTLPPEIARIVSIVIEFAAHSPFTFGEFERFMDKLMNDVPGLTYTQVLFVTEKLNDGKSARQPVDRSGGVDPADDPELTFHPAIDKNSDALAKKHGRSDRPSVFEALNQYYDHYKERQAQATKQRDREFARTHPFQPTFVAKDRNAKATKFYDKLHHQDMATTIGTAMHAASKDMAPSLRTAVPNARPFVRPLGRSPSDQTLTSSVAGDDDDAMLTSHVLAALGDGSFPPPPPPMMVNTLPAAAVAASKATAHSTASFMARYSAAAAPPVSSGGSTISTHMTPPLAVATTTATAGNPLSLADMAH